MGEQMSRIAYYRCSTGDQSIEAQRKALGGNFDREFSDVGVSGAVLAEDRPGFADLLNYIREDDTLYQGALISTHVPIGAFRWT